MEVLLVVLFLALIAGGIVIWIGSHTRETEAGPGGVGTLAAGATPAASGGAEARGIKAGDVVNHDGRDYIVEGTLRLEQGGYRWDEHRLVDAGDTIWVSVEDDEGLEIIVWDRRKGTGLEPGAQTIDLEGTTYTLDERGNANFTSEGVTGMAPGGVMEYADYEAGDKRLSFERGKGEESWEVSVGQTIDEGLLDIYPSRGTP